MAFPGSLARSHSAQRKNCTLKVGVSAVAAFWKSRCRRSSVLSLDACVSTNFGRTCARHIDGHVWMSWLPSRLWGRCRPPPAPRFRALLRTHLVLCNCHILFRIVFLRAGSVAICSSASLSRAIFAPMMVSGSNGEGASGSARGRPKSVAQRASCTRAAVEPKGAAARKSSLYVTVSASVGRHPRKFRRLDLFVTK